MNEAAQILENSPAPTINTGEGKGTEAPTEGTPDPAPKVEDKISSRLDILIRREANAVARERMAKQKEAEIEAKLAKIAEFEAAKDDPTKAMSLLGTDYDTLT